MGELMLRKEKNREGWMSGSIAGNQLSVPIYRITAAVLHNYGRDRVAQLYEVIDLNESKPNVEFDHRKSNI
jgi:hypothetical protein